VNPDRQEWNSRHKRLRKALSVGDRPAVCDLFAKQHAMVHSSRVSSLELVSFEDEILEGLSDQQIRLIAPGSQHSVVWILWHITRIEDVVMNLLVTGSSQVLHANGWQDKLGTAVTHTGNSMGDREVRQLSGAMNIDQLKEYRAAVGRETLRIVSRLDSRDYKSRVDAVRVQRIWAEKALLRRAKSILDYWASRTIAELLLMPPLRHCLLHLNEARRLECSLLKKRGSQFKK